MILPLLLPAALFLFPIHTTPLPLSPRLNPGPGTLRITDLEIFSIRHGVGAQYGVHFIGKMSPALCRSAQPGEVMAINLTRAFPEEDMGADLWVWWRPPPPPPVGEVGVERRQDRLLEEDDASGPGAGRGGESKGMWDHPPDGGSAPFRPGHDARFVVGGGDEGKGMQNTYLPPSEDRRPGHDPRFAARGGGSGWWRGVYTSRGGGPILGQRPPCT